MASANLQKTFSSAGNLKTGTQSFWIKRGNISANMMAGITITGGGSYYGIQFLTDDVLDIYWYYNSSASAWQGRLKTNRKFRDVNGWYHFVLAWDTTQSTASDRLKFYVNGVQETSFSISSYPNQNQDLLFNTAAAHVINSAAGGNWDGQMAHFHYVDGTAYTPSTFGETDTTTGIWKPKASPSGISYGTNGFFLKFDNSANMGLDSSGQSNNWTTSGTIIQNKDTPSNVFNCLSPIDVPIKSDGNYGVFPTLSNANTSITNTNSAFREIRSNIYVTKGKYYFEAKPTRIGGSGAFQVGVQLRNYSSGTGERRAYQNNGYKYTPGSASYGASYAANDVVGVALNLTDGEITFYKNGVSQGVAATDMLSGMDNVGWTAAASCYDADGHFNFGNGYFGTTAVSSAQNPDDGIGIFEYDPPTGYRAICTKSLNAQEYS
jgi:hypothetical protein